MSKERLNYLDNLRILLTIFVIFVHISMMYGAMSSWYYNEVLRPDPLTEGTLTILLLLGRSCGLGIFFALSGYFTALKMAENKENSRKYMTSRMIRLGVPLLFFLLFIAPFAKIMVAVILYNQPFNLIDIYYNYFRYFNGSQVGPLWFIELLLVFTILYFFWFKYIQKGKPVSLPDSFKNFPSTKFLIVFIILLSVLTFLVRVEFGEGYYWPAMNLEFANLLQYILFFILGTWLPQTNWLSKIPAKAAKGWLIVSLINVFIVLPAVYTFVVLSKGNFIHFRGGWHWFSVFLTTWEIVNLVAYSITVFYYFRKSVNKQGRIARFFIPNLYVAYVVHPLVVILLAMLFRNVHLYPLIKIALFSPIAIFASFYTAHLLRMIPGAKQLLQEKV